MTAALSFDPAKLDQYIDATSPVRAVSHGSHEPLREAGHRYLVAREGLFVEVSRPWLHAVLPAGASAVPLPFGSANALRRVTLRCGPLPARLLAQFVEQALKALPNECGAWIVWNEHTHSFELLEVEAICATAERLAYLRPNLDPGCHLVVKLQ